MSREAMKLALEALKNINSADNDRDFLGPEECCDLDNAITALREALAEQPAQKCSYPYCGCSSKAWCKVERNEALDKMAENARELGLDYEPEQEPVAWEGGEGWESLAWELCANENGEDSCNELIWEGGPIPEPWGDRWMKYEEEAKRLIALVQKHTTPPAQPELAPGYCKQCKQYSIEEPLPAAQRQWVGLTQEEIEDCYGGEIDDFARAIEAKLREKNT
jgi:hypothetical protein